MPVLQVSFSTQNAGNAADLHVHQAPGAILCSGKHAGAQAAKGGRKKRGPLEALQENAVEATPLPGDKSRAVPFTPAGAPTVMRAPRLGEVFYSQTGAPAGSAHQCWTARAFRPYQQLGFVVYSKCCQAFLGAQIFLPHRPEGGAGSG